MNAETGEKRGYANSVSKFNQAKFEKYPLKFGENLFIESIGDSSE